MLRLVAEGDAADLLTCYADPMARLYFNSDTCTSNFFFDSVAEMRECIKIWLISYTRQEYVRFSIIDTHSKHAVGTIEMFGMVGKYKTDRGIFRLDIASKYEKATYLNQLYSLGLSNFFDIFAVNLIVTKAIPTAVERVNVLQKLGFTSYDFPGRQNYWCRYRKQ